MTSFLAQEIASQPEVIDNLLRVEADRVWKIAGELPHCAYALIAARGTSDHAATYAKYLWASLAGYPVALATPSLHTLYSRPPRMEGALVVAISQSGQSPDIVAVLQEGKRQGRPTLAITNDSNSPLAAAADHVVELHAGVERSVAATKTYTAQMVIMALLAAGLSREQARMEELKRVPQALAVTLAQARSVEARAERYRYMEDCVVIGRGYNYATALELALKIKELTYVMAIAYSSADFRHGPIATISEGTPAILIMPGGATYADMLDLARDLEGRGAELLIAGDEDEALSLATTRLPLAGDLPEWLSPIPAIVPGQLLALHLALAKGYDPDQPRGLRKVTLTH
jgi:glutamine---fructose-6-phosphate transaminase (isomerizing)